MVATLSLISDNISATLSLISDNMVATILLFLALQDLVLLHAANDTCIPGKRIQSEDGCNSCECLDGIRVVCTDMECVYLSKPEKHKSGSSSGHGKHSRRSNPV